MNEIKQKEKENQKKITFLSNKLEEKLLDNQLLTDKRRQSPSKYSENSYKIEDPYTYYTTREAQGRKYSNPELCRGHSEYTNKILALEIQLKKYKQKYNQLKKLYLKKHRKSSIESKKTNSVSEKLNKKSLSKRRMSTKNHDKCTSCNKKNMTPRVTPH